MVPQNAGRGQGRGLASRDESLSCKSLSHSAACWLQTRGTP